MWPFSPLIDSEAGSQPLTLNLSDLASSYSDQSFETQTYGIDFRLSGDGTIDVLRDVNPDLSNEQVDYVDPTGRLNEVHARMLYISGDHLTGGLSEDTWYPLSTTPRQWTMRYTSSGGVDFIAGTFRIQLSTDGGSTVDETKTITLTVGENF